MRRRCSICGNDGHTKRTCSHRKQINEDDQKMFDKPFKKLPRMSDAVFYKLRNEAHKKGFRIAREQRLYMIKRLNQLAEENKLTYWDNYVAGMSK